MVVLYTIMYVCIIMHTLEHTYTYTPNRHVEYTHLKYIHIFNNAEENTFSEKKKGMLLILLIRIEHTDFRINVYLIGEITFLT